MTIPTNDDDLIDVRDVIARVEHLEQLRQPGPVDLGEDDNEQDQDSLFAELASLEALLGELVGNGGDEQWRGDWYPVTLIRESHFVEYCQELCADIGDLPTALPSYIVIDWQATARNIRMDYLEVEFAGVVYMTR